MYGSQRNPTGWVPSANGRLGGQRLPTDRAHGPDVGACGLPKRMDFPTDPGRRRETLAERQS